MTDSASVRWWQKVIPTGGCWHWVGARTALGYGNFNVGGHALAAHRVGYKMLRGQIPDDVVLDHLCRNPGCVNPDHLEPVTQRTNLLRGVGPTATGAAQTHCKRGHELSGSNVRHRSGGSHGLRECKACASDAQRARHQKRQPETMEAE